MNNWSRMRIYLYKRLAGKSTFDKQISKISNLTIQKERGSQKLADGLKKYLFENLKMKKFSH